MIKLLPLIMLLALLFSCGQKDKETPPQKIEELSLVLDPVLLNEEFGNLDLTRIARLTQSQYDSLQLVNVEELTGYDINYLSMGSVLLENENGKIITVRIITDGEATEFLLSYDRNGILMDNLMVAYEDLVEYYSEVTSRIQSNKIAVKTINYTYGDESGNTMEKSDTLIANYMLTNDLRIVME